MTRINDLIQEISDVVSYDFSDLQPWTDLRDWPLGESRDIDGTLSTKVLHSSMHLRFIAHLPPGTLFPRHYHDCVEVCTLISGEMKCDETHQHATQDQRMVFSAGIKHTPYNPNENQPCWVQVDFYKLT